PLDTPPITVSFTTNHSFTDSAEGKAKADTGVRVVDGELLTDAALVAGEVSDETSTEVDLVTASSTSDTWLPHPPARTTVDIMRSGAALLRMIHRRISSMSGLNPGCENSSPGPIG
ncbi:MAG: hypothetical protein ACO4A0_10770, partial [Ilumatobacteraceae bacterium]